MRSSNSQRVTALLIFCIALLLPAACAGPPQRTTAPEQMLVQKAIDTAGGEAALAGSPVLIWSGEATVYAGEHRIDLDVETVVRPFDKARSDTWLREKGRSTLRRLEIDGGRGWTTRDGVRTPMPTQMLVHEREQYGIYGLMRLLPLRDPTTRLQMLPLDPQGRAGLRVERPGMPATDLYFESDGRLAWLRNRVDSPEGGAPIEQRIDLSGTIDGAGIHWPRALKIAQDGKPYFDLTLTAFNPRATWDTPSP